ncbi:MAG: acyltransferase [Gammaproteobacteria bacterium]|nr:acyltransferase [Gammaproteobacteria bacterium]NNC58204.1 acyltransferase [Woeseiaceae bacterium]
MGNGSFAAGNASNLAINERRADLDWLRVIAFGLLIYFHAAIAFVPGGIPMIQNAETSTFLQVMIGFLHEFRLALLFLISGVGVSFALRHRDRSQFMRDRAVRLLVPLVFGVLVIVPPMIFLEKRFIGDFSGSFAGFYPMFFTEGVYPAGNLSWHHYWFIAYLFLFCILGWPIFSHFKGSAGRKQLGHWSQRFSRGARLYYAIVPLAVVEIALRAWFPGFPDLIHDWANFSHWLIIFIAGFLLASSRPLLDRTQALRSHSLALALVATAALFAQFWSPEEGGFTPLDNGQTDIRTYVWFCVLRVSNVWFWLLTCLGYAGRYLQRPGRLLTYLNGAVYPLFCLHLTIIVALEYVIVPLDWSILSKFLAITTGTVALSIGGYELFSRRISWMRPLLGLKRLKGTSLPIASPVVSDGYEAKDLRE